MELGTTKPIFDRIRVAWTPSTIDMVIENLSYFLLLNSETVSLIEFASRTLIHIHSIESGVAEVIAGRIPEKFIE